MIQQFFNMMFTLMIGKFMLNDVPHYLFEEITMRTLRVKRIEEEEYATPAQLRYIAILSAKLKMPEPVVKYKGEAGLMIRHLEAEVEGRKRLGSRNPGGEEELKTEDNVEVYTSSEIPLDIAQDTGLHRDPQVEYRYTTYYYGPDLNLFQRDLQRLLRERTGIPYLAVDAYYIRQGEKSSTLEEPTGTCYPDAWRFLMQRDEGHLVHGSVQLSAEGARVKHAWVELPSGFEWEPQTKQYFTIEDFGIFSPIAEYRYTIEQAAIMVARTGKHGPWSEEERRQWL